MGKKRRVWWVGGGLCLVALFMYGMLDLRASSADAKMDATLNEVFLQNAIEHRFLESAIVRGESVTTYMHRADELTAHEADHVLKTIKDAGQDCTVLADDSIGIAEGYVLETGDSYRSISTIRVSRYENPNRPEADDRMYIVITVARRYKTSLKDRINYWFVP